MTRDNLAFVAGVVILAAWLFTVVFAVRTNDTGVLQYVSPVMLILAGYLFGVDILKRKQGGGDG